MDANGRDYLLLDYAQRRRDGVDDTLVVFRVDNRKLILVFEARLSCARDGNPGRAQFAYHATPAKEGGLKVDFVASDKQSTEPESQDGDPFCSQKRSFWIDPKTESGVLAPKSLEGSDPRVMVLHGDSLGGWSTTNHDPCEFRGDMVVLAGTEWADQPIALVFCSSYGIARARGVSDRNGRRYVALEYREGHGTGFAETPYLGIYRLERQGLNELFRLELAWPTGMTQAFEYSYKFGPVDGGGVALQLDGNADEKSECCVPSEKSRLLVIDSPR